MNSVPLLVSALVIFTGCQVIHERPKHGEEWATDPNGQRKLTTYVTAEEYERMTKDERERTGATVAASVSFRIGKPDSQGVVPPKPITASELDRVLAEPRAQK